MDRLRMQTKPRPERLGEHERGPPQGRRNSGPATSACSSTPQLRPNSNVPRVPNRIGSESTLYSGPGYHLLERGADANAPDEVRYYHITCLLPPLGGSRSGTRFYEPSFSFEFYVCAYALSEIALTLHE
jgi:hypothetical protein